MERTDQRQTLPYYQARFDRLSLQTQVVIEAVSLFDQALQCEADAKVLKIDIIQPEK